MSTRVPLLILLGLLALGQALQCPKQKTSPGREIVCYTSVSEADQLTDTICRCTTLIHEGHDVRNFSTSDVQAFKKSLKEINPPLQFVISVDDPAKILQTSSSIRQEATARLIRVLKEVDGVQLNVTMGSKERLLQFVKGLEDEIVRKSYDKRLFLVLSTKPEDLAKQFDLKELSKYVDLFTVATHYLVDEDEAYHTFHPSRMMGLFDMINTDSLVDLISGLGAPKRKILVSVPASAYKFTLKDQNENAPRSPTIEEEPVVIDRNQLCDSINDGEWTIERDEDLTAPYAFKNTTWISFEDNLSASIKGKYVLLRDLPGLAIHDIENDRKTKCGKPLTHEIYHSFTDFKRKSRAAVLNALEDELHQSQITYPTKVKSSNYRVVRVVDTGGHIRAVRENTQTEFTCVRQGYFVHPKSCNRFYRCVKFNQEVEDYSVFEFDCPAGLAFDERTEVCVWPGSLPQGSPCPGSSEIAPETRTRFECPAQTGYYADPQNPRWFFACMDLGGPELMAFEFRCPYELIFDERKLACEWPWLVEGHDGMGYNLYNSGTYGQGAGGGGGYSSSASTAGHGATGGFTVGTGGGQSSTQYSGHTTYSGKVGTGFSGAAGVGYSGSASNAQGSSSGSGYAATTGSGYSGSTVGGGYSGSTGKVGYSGSTVGGGYSGSTGAADYSGSTGGAGYSGSTGGAGYSGSTVGGGYSGSTVGGGYSGSTVGGGYSGSTGGAGYSGTTGGVGYSGSTVGGGYSGSTVGGGYSGSTGGAGYSGTTGGVGYSGSTGGAGYSGSNVGGGYSGSTGEAGYSGSIGEGAYSGSTIGAGYSGSTSGGQSSFTGTSGNRPSSTSSIQFSNDYSGSTGNAYSGGTGSISTGTIGSGYSGSTADAILTSGGAGYSTSTGGGFTSDSVHTGPTVGVYSGVPGGTSTEDRYSGFSGSADGSYSGSTSGTYFGSTGIGHSGSTGTNNIYSNAIGGGATSIAIDHSGSAGATYQHGTNEIYTGTVDSSRGGTDSSFGYTKPSFTGQSSIGTDYLGSTSKAHQGSTSGTNTGSTGTSYTGFSSGGYSGQAGYSVSTDEGYSGSTDVKYNEATIGGHAGSTGGGYSGSTGGGYSGATTSGISSGQSTGYSSAGYDRGYSVETSRGYGTSSGYPGSSPTVTISGSSATSQSDYSGSGLKQTDSTKKGYTQYIEEGYTIPVAIEAFPGNIPIQFPGGAAGTGHVGSGGTTGSQDQTINVAVIGQGQAEPGSDYHPNTIGFGVHTSSDSASSVRDQGFTTSGQVSSHGVSTGSLFPGQSQGTVYVGTTGGKGVPGTTYLGPGVTHPGGKSDLNITLIGSSVPSLGTTYHPGIGTSIGGTGTYTVGGRVPGTGAIITGHSVEGSITTGDSTSGTVLTHGDVSGTVLTGSSDQGSIATGGSYPGYTKTGGSTPGYVISGGTKIYTDSGSPGTVVHGTPSPGVVLTGPSVPSTVIRGQPSPGVTLTGQTSPGVVIGGSIVPGTGVGSTGPQYFPDSGFTTGTNTYTGGSRTGTVSVTQDTGYKTNEYHDNGGRGTVKFNNGYQTTKYTEKDLPDYYPGGITIPVSILSDGNIEPGAGVAPTVSPTLSVPTATPTYSSIRPGSVTPSGFTKTGPTRTGITTATLGGRGGYVISTGKDKAIPSYENIGEKAFTGNVAGFTKSSTESSVSEGTYSAGFSTESSALDTSKPGGSSGYSYPKPSVQFQTGRVTAPSTSPVSSTERTILSGTTPTPFLNVEMYNTPTVGSSGSVTATYTFSKPGGQYPGSTSGTGRVPSGFTTSKLFSPTPSTIGYTTGPLENYKTTLFEAARIPVTISTVQPVIDTGHKTVVSPTVIPVTITQDKYGGSYQTGFSTQSKSELGIGTSFQGTSFGMKKDYNLVTTPSSVPGGYSSGKPRPFGPTVTYEQQTVTVQPETNYVYSTPESGSSYSFESTKTFGQGTTPSKSQTQYIPPAVGVTYRKPFPVPGITYQESTPASTIKPSLQPQGFSKPSTFASFDSSYSDEKYLTQQRESGSTFVPSTGTGGSPTNVDIDRDEVGKLITNYDRGTIRYTPSVYDTYTGTDFTGTTASTFDRDYSRKETSASSSLSSSSSSSSSSSFSGTYGTSTVAPFGRTERPLTVTTYIGGYSKPISVSSSYEVTTKPTTVQPKGKVIVKWSDLHPLLLGKLGAECTCRADPFANLRGPGRKLIDSSRGKIDLANYDESEIYVDLERDGAYDDGDYVTTYETSSPRPIKIMNVNSPVVSLLDNPKPGGDSKSRGQVSSTYLPASSTSSPLVGRVPSVPSTGNLALGASLTASASIPVERTYTSGQRTGKNLNYPESVPSSAEGKGASFDRYGPGGFRDADEVLEGVNDCARPGLFRHPNFCNKFYACHWDEWKKKFTLHVFNCPVHLTFDSNASACNWPSKGPACQDDNLLV